jgi:ABC-type transporter Mla subunit MlaD
MRALEPEVQNVFLQAMEEALVGRELEVQDLVAEAGSLLQTLAARDDQIGRVLENAAEFTTELAQRDDAIRDMLASFAGSAELIAERNDQLEALILQLGDAQAELRRMLEAGRERDAEIRRLDGLPVRVRRKLRVRRLVPVARSLGGVR